MDVFKIGTVSLAFLFIQGCSSSQPPDPPPPPAKTVFDPLTQQLDRARDVQNTVNQNAEATHKAIDSQERGDTSP
jgi:hypothetical protein